MRILKQATGVIFAALLLIAAGCAHYPVNPPLTSVAPQPGYRYDVVREAPDPERPFVLLAFSGGGTRAAAFSFGLMEELRKVKYERQDGSSRHLTDDIEIISSISGGSFTAAYYALFPVRFYQDFPDKFLYRNIQGALVARMFNPYNWWRLASADFSRIDMVAEFYNEQIFDEQTFANLLSKGRQARPFVVLNSTDIGINHRFEFTQDQFDLLCSDLSGVTVARGVAASSNFPVAFAPMTLNVYKNNCPSLPEWVDLAIQSKSFDRRYVDASAAASYREEDSRFVHLLDGGLTDNLGLRAPFNAITTTDSGWSVVKHANEMKLDRLMVIAANAKTTKQRSWNKSSSPPGIADVLDVVMNGPMDDVSLDSVEMTENHFQNMQQLAGTIDACNSLLSKCPKSKQIKNPIVTDFTFAELSFDYIKDDHLRHCLQSLPTSFKLSRETVDLLRVSAARLLMTSEPFIRGMQNLDVTWQPRSVDIDPTLVTAVCGPVEP